VQSPGRHRGLTSCPRSGGGRIAAGEPHVLPPTKEAPVAKNKGKKKDKKSKKKDKKKKGKKKK
jgi:hypothetical protein